MTTTLPSEVLSPAEQAHRIHGHTVALAEKWRRGSDELAKLIYAIRTVKIGDKYVWEYMGHDSEKSYFAAPVEAGGLDLGWRMVRKYSNVHRDIREIAGVPEALTKGVDRDKQDMARKLIVRDGQKVASEEQILEVLCQAKANSRSDFRLWINEQLGIAPPEPPPEAASGDYNSPLDLNNDDKVRAGGQLWFDMHYKANCCLRPWKPGERAHIPVSKGAGGRDWEFCVLPLCREDHDDSHSGIETWMGKKCNHQGLFRYLYRCIFVLLEEVRQLKEERDVADRG